MAMLYSGLDATAAGEVVAELEAEGVAFEVDGAAILVDAAARDRIRMQLAAKGLPAGGPAGYEILDSLSGFGTTSQMFDAAYWRAKEGELARTITGSPERARGAGPPRQPGVAALLPHAGGLGLGHRDHGARRARPRPGRGDPLSRLLRRRRHRARGGGGDRRRAGRRARRQGRPARPAARRARTSAPRRCAPTSSACSRRGSGRAGPSSRSTSTPTWTARRSASAPSTRRAGWRSARRPRRARRTPPAARPGVTVASNLPDGDVGRRTRATASATANREPRAAELRGLRDPARAGDPARARSARISVAVMVDGIIADRRRRQGDLGAAAGGGDGDAAPAGALGDRLRRGARRHGHDRVAAVHPAARAGLAGRARRVGLPRRSGAAGWPSSACSARSCWRSSSSCSGR